MKLLGIVVLYYPNEDLVDNILSYLPFLDQLVIWDNTPKEFQKKIRIEDAILQDKILYWGENDNVGLGKAFNQVIDYATREGGTHLLTMDQDSFFVENDFAKYVDAIKGEEIAIFSPNYIIQDKKLYPEQKTLLEVEYSMTSGSIYPVAIFNEIGGFRCDFFIDIIDIEFCLRAKKSGIPTKIITGVNLNHKLGYKKKKHRFLWKTISPNEYSPIRSYYMIRNSLVTKKLYPEANVWKGYLSYYFYQRIFFVVLYEKNKKFITWVHSWQKGYDRKTSK